MTLFEQIKADQLTARKSRNALASNLLTTLIGELTTMAKNDGNREVCDADVVKLVKKFNDGMEQTAQYCAGNNPEGQATALAEMEIIGRYMPQQMSEAAVRAEIEKIIAVTGKNMGAVMAALKSQFAGQYDAEAASAIVKSLL